MSALIPSFRAPSSDFPSDVLKCMKANAKPKLALKLMKCCKYFQHPEFPYFVVKSIEHFTRDEQDKWYLTTLDDQDQVIDNIENNRKQFWITEEITLAYTPNLIDFLIPKIAVCDIRHLTIEDQNLTFDKFKFLTSEGTVEQLFLRNATINTLHDDSIFINDILKCVPNVKKFSYYSNQPSLFIPSNDSIDIFQNMDTSKIKSIYHNLTSYTYFIKFLDFLNQHRHIKYHLYFNNDSLSLLESEAVKKYVQNIIDTSLTEFPPPRIDFLGQSSVQSAALKSLRTRWNMSKN